MNSNGEHNEFKRKLRAGNEVSSSCFLGKRGTQRKQLQEMGGLPEGGYVGFAVQELNGCGEVGGDRQSSGQQ